MRTPVVAALACGLVATLWVLSSSRSSGDEELIVSASRADSITKAVTEDTLLHNGHTGHSRHNDVVQAAAVELMQSLAHAPVRGGDVFVARMLPILTPSGLRLVTRTFTESFRIAVETACRPGNDGPDRTVYNASKYRHLCNTNPKLWDAQGGGCNAKDTGGDWCTKFSAEWVIPSIIASSPWAASTDGNNNSSGGPPIDAVVVQTEWLCFGPYVAARISPNICTSRMSLWLLLLSCTTCASTQAPCAHKSSCCMLPCKALTLPCMTPCSECASTQAPCAHKSS
jgi:hypothetical protein